MSRKLSEIQFQIGNSPAKTTQNHYTQVTRRSTEVSIDMERNSVPNSRSWNKVYFLLPRGDNQSLIALAAICIQIDPNFLTDTGEDSKLVHRLKRPKVDALFSFIFFRRVRAMSMTQRRVENTRVHFWTFSPVSVKT